MRSGEEEKKKEEEEEKEKSANIKSNNPHLAGGEKHDLYMDQYTLHIPWESKTVYIQSYGALGIWRKNISFEPDDMGHRRQTDPVTQNDGVADT